VDYTYPITWGEVYSVDRFRGTEALYQTNDQYRSDRLLHAASCCHKVSECQLDPFDFIRLAGLLEARLAGLEPATFSVRSQNTYVYSCLCLLTRCARLQRAVPDSVRPGQAPSKLSNAPVISCLPAPDRSSRERKRRAFGPSSIPALMRPRSSRSVSEPVKP
jgi:hypothetical protein